MILKASIFSASSSKLLRSRLSLSERTQFVYSTECKRWSLSKRRSFVEGSVHCRTGISELWASRRRFCAIIASKLHYKLVSIVIAPPLMTHHTSNKHSGSITCLNQQVNKMVMTPTGSNIWSHIRLSDLIWPRKSIKCQGITQENKYTEYRCSFVTLRVITYDHNITARITKTVTI